MKDYSQYWIATLVRGIVAIVAGTGVLFFPQLLSTVLLRPIGIVAAILVLAAYGTIDSAIVLASSFMIPPGRPGRFALRLQGIAGALIGTFLFALVYHRTDLRWFVFLAALQAAAAAVTEFIVARGTSAHHAAGWCYASAAIAAIAGVMLLLGRDRDNLQLTWMLFVYLGLFGFNLLALAARMLFAERELLHPANP